MSKSSNASRLAKKIRDQSALTLSTSSRLAKQVHTFLGSPIADAPDRHQRRLEACVAHVLATGFQDRQLNGALLGALDAQPTAGHLTLQLEPDMADEVLRVLLPRFDEHYGGVRGVAGLRLRSRRRQIALCDALSPARIMVVRADGGPLRLPTARDGETLLWQRETSGVSQEEESEATDWARSMPAIVNVPVRDLLFSRILRRPALVNRVAAPHGLANCYTHHSGDLVIEWCCGDTVEAFCAVLLAHGFIDDLPRPDAIELLSPHAARLGGRTVILQRHSTCMFEGERFSDHEVARRIRRDYAS
ncbi:hypothetical protein ACH4GK_07885 [Streptomyces rimosus]|uniref:hypothetical protein n=1 Tax=Streptomyces rimosus TaxID=1927 RepID=UPI00099E0D85|nr:hypothetical protein [Streptomyces rimosus]